MDVLGSRWEPRPQGPSGCPALVVLCLGSSPGARRALTSRAVSLPWETSCSGLGGSSGPSPDICIFSRWKGEESQTAELRAGAGLEEAHFRWVEKARACLPSRKNFRCRRLIPVTGGRAKCLGFGWEATFR